MCLDWIDNDMGFCHSLWGIPTVDGLKAALTPPTTPLPHVGFFFSLLPAFSLTYRVFWCLAQPETLQTHFTLKSHWKVWEYLRRIAELLVVG